MEVLYFEFSLYSLFFFAIYQTTETLLLCCLYSTGIHPPTPLLSNLSTMALTKTSIIKTRSQSRTGTKARMTNPAAPAPTHVTVAAGRTTGTTNDPVPPVVTTTDPAPPVNLFAGRPTTGTLKDPPLAVPTTRARDSDSDSGAKKPAAKPKPKPKKVAPTKARKPRKPRTDPADDLVDPMANIHVGDATGVRL